MKSNDKFEVERIACGANNCFIVSQGDNSILVDTATLKYRGKILAKCVGRDVKLIFITHGHYDHTQNAAYLAENLKVPVAMHEADVPLLAEMPIPKAHALLGRVMVAFMRLAKNNVTGKIISLFQNASIPPFKPDILLKDGDYLGEYGVSAEVVALPGHTNGSIGLKLGETGLIAGDAMMNIVRPQKAPHYLDRAAMEQSFDKIKS